MLQNVLALQNISDFKNNDDLLPIFLAVIIIDFIVILIAKHTTFFWKANKCLV